MTKGHAVAVTRIHISILFTRFLLSDGCNYRKAIAMVKSFNFTFTAMPSGQAGPLVTRPAIGDVLTQEVGNPEEFAEAVDKLIAAARRGGCPTRK